MHLKTPINILQMLLLVTDISIHFLAFLRHYASITKIHAESWCMIQKITSQNHLWLEPPMHFTFRLIIKSQQKGMVNLHCEADWKVWFCFIISWLTDSTELWELQWACEKQDLNQTISRGWFSLLSFSQ